MKPRDGFTLLELITVMIIVGLLAAIAVSRFWAVKERSYKVAMKDGLRTVAVQQERYFERNHAYAASVAALPDFDASQGVTVNVTWATANGWAAQAEHVSVPGEFCGYFTGPAPGGIAAPATQSGVIACD
jgi:prepilin-type N-terminal cleavage/methylation domain-containing protein